MSDEANALVRASSEPSLAERLKRTAELNTELMKLWPDRGSISVMDVDHRELHASGFRQAASGSGNEWMVSVSLAGPGDFVGASLYGEWEPTCAICRKLVEYAKDIEERVRQIFGSDRRVER